MSPRGHGRATHGDFCSQQQRQYSAFAPGFNPPTQSQGDNVDSYSQFQSQHATVRATTDDVHYSNHHNSNRIISGTPPQQSMCWDRKKSKKRRKRYPLPGPAGLTSSSHPHLSSFSKNENGEGGYDNNIPENSCGEGSGDARALSLKRQRKKLKHDAQQYQQFWQVVHHPAWLKMCMALERYVKVDSPQPVSSSGNKALQDRILNEYTFLSQVFADNLLSIPLIAVLLTTTSVSVEDSMANYYSFVGSPSEGGENLTTCHIMDESSGLVAVGWVSESIFCENDGRLNNRSGSQRQHCTIVVLLKDVPVMVLPRDEQKQHQEAGMATTLSNDVKMDRVLLVSPLHVICKWTESTDTSNHGSDKELSNEALQQKHRLDQLCRQRYLHGGDMSPQKIVDANKEATSPASLTVVLENNGNANSAPLPNVENLVVVHDFSGTSTEQARNAVASSKCPLQSQECEVFALSKRPLQNEEYAQDRGALLDEANSLISVKTAPQQENSIVPLANVAPVCPSPASHPLVSSIALSNDASALPIGGSDHDASSVLTVERTNQDLHVNICPASLFSTKLDAVQSGAVADHSVPFKTLSIRINETHEHPGTAIAVPDVPLPLHQYDHYTENRYPAQPKKANVGEADDIYLKNPAQPKSTNSMNDAVPEEEKTHIYDKSCTHVDTAITVVSPFLLFAAQTELPGLGELADDNVDERDRAKAIGAQATLTKTPEDKENVHDLEKKGEASEKRATFFPPSTSASQFNEFGIDDLSDDSDGV